MHDAPATELTDEMEEVLDTMFDPVSKERQTAINAVCITKVVHIHTTTEKLYLLLTKCCS